MKVNKKEYLTITEMAEILGITYLAAKQRLLRAGIKAVSYEALYDASSLEAIRNVPGKGRPKKAVPGPEPAKPRANKPAKPKK
jgi:predicted ArsR family transcriptional regulator